MKRKLFLLCAMALVITGAMFWSCQKEELLNPEDGLMLKNGKKSEVQVAKIDIQAELLVTPVTICIEDEVTLTAQALNGTTPVTGGKMSIEELIEGDDPETDEVEAEYWKKVAGFLEFSLSVTNLQYTFNADEIGSRIFRAHFVGGQDYSNDQDVKTINVINCACETSFKGETVCGIFGDENQYNRKAVYSFSTEYYGSFIIQGGLTNFTGVEYDLQVSDGTITSRIPGNSSNRIITAEGILDDCGEVIVTVYWKSTNADLFITGDWSVELNGEKILVIDQLKCDDNGEGYEPIPDGE
jgi:hypothetical protein